MCVVADIWHEEDDDDDENKLEDKQELMQSFNWFGPIADQAKEMAIQLRDRAKVEVRSSIGTLLFRCNPDLLRLTKTKSPYP